MPKLKKRNYKEVLAKTKANKEIAKLRGQVAASNLDELRVGVLAATLEVLGVDAELILAIDDKELAGAYLLRAAYIGAAKAQVGIQTDDLVRIFNEPIGDTEDDGEID